ncbi:MAG: PKD domain-containing protein, partial [bacterium]|nr:PKD domain-containing protein [bacterium]
MMRQQPRSSRALRIPVPALFALAIVGCSPGIGNNLPSQPNTGLSASVNLPTGFDLGFVPTSPIGELAIAGVDVPAIGATAAREIVLLAFSTAAAADDGDGTGTLLSRDSTAGDDTNGASDVFLAIVSAQDIDSSAFSQSLAGKFRHPRCVTCHSMQAADTTAFVSSPLVHAGPLPGPGFPNNDPSTCEACHVTSTNFPVEGWQAPAASFDFRNRTIAELAAAAQNVPADELEHFVTDKRVLWALDSGVLPQVGGRNGVADDDHDGVLEPSDTDGVIRTVPGGSVNFLRDIEAWHDGGNKLTNADAVADVTLVSRVSGGSAAGNGASGAPAIVWVANPTFDPDNVAATNPVGTIYVAFQTDATDLVAGDGNGQTDVIRVAVELRAEQDETGNAAVGGLNLHAVSSSNVLASSRDGAPTNATGGSSTRPAIGGSNGEIVVFESNAQNLVGAFTDGNGADPDIFVRDVDNTTTRLVSHSMSNQATGGNGASANPAVASNGTVAAFESDATDLVASDANGVRDVYHTRINAVPPYTRVRSSVSDAGAEGSGGASRNPDVHEDGSGRIRVVFESDKTDLANVTASTNAFLFDSSTGFTMLLNQVITPDQVGGPTIGDGAARAPVIAGDGSMIAFESDSTNLDVLRADGNGVTDIYLLEVSQLDDGFVLPYRANVTSSESSEGDGASTGPVLGAFASSTMFGTGFVAYSTAAVNLGTSDSTDVMLSFLAETSGVIVDFSADVQSGPAPLTVKFTDESSGSPTSWQWDFDNDGNVDSTEQNPTHVFAAPGSYSVKLTAQNAVTEGTKTAADFISAIGPVAADFTATPGVGGLPLTVTFMDTSTGPATSWAWDFDNDGTVDSTDQNPMWTYNSLGGKTVTLTASNQLGPDTITKVDVVTV